MDETVFHKLKETKEKPVALIVKTKDFVDSFLKKALLMYGCQVEFFSDQISKEEFKTFDYIFCFSQDFPQIKKLLDLPDEGTKFLFALGFSSNQSLLENKIFKYSQEKKKDVRLVRFSHVYGPGMPEEDYQHLKKSYQGFGIQPLFVSDFIYGLLKAMFGGGTAKQTFSLMEEDKRLGWKPKVSLKRGLNQVEEYFEKEKLVVKESLFKKPFPLREIFKRTKEEEQASPSRRVSIRVSMKYWRLLLVVLLFLLISYPFTSLAFYGLLGSRYLKQAQTLVLEGNLTSAGKKAATAQDFFKKGQQQSVQLSRIFEFVSESKAGRINNLFFLGKTAAEGINSLIKAADRASVLAKAVFQKEPANVRDLIVEIKLDLEKSFNRLSLVEGQFSNEGSIKEVARVRNLLLQARKGIELLPELIGLDKKQTYLVLFQNSSELRPTGGFIGSYGILTFNEGQLTDFEVHDVYVADGQLKGHVEPPEDLKKYLGEAGWYLRDSNWDIDFPSSAIKASWFFEKETGRSVDGVLGINLFLAQKVLQATGEIQLPDYQEKINADNFFDRAEYYSEINFFPGSTQKQDFLGGVARVLFEKLKESDQKTLFTLAKNVYPGLIAKDFLIWLDNPKATAIIQELGWDGGIKNVNCLKEEGCFVDYLLISEANVGINKANYFLKRSLSHQIRVQDDGLVESTLQLDYRNDSQSEAFPAGRYKSYLRIYAPLEAELVSVNIKNPSSGEIQEVEEIERMEEHERQIFGFLVEVPIQESRSLEVVYRLKEKLGKKVNRYLFFLQKQPGIKDEFFSLWFMPPSDRQAFSSMDFSQTTDGLLFHPQFNQDLLFEINLVR